MRYLFIGATDGNTGPSNVNKGIVANLTHDFLVVNMQGKVKKYLNVITNIFRCDAVVVSGLSKVGLFSIKLAKCLRKKSIYIMHGCYEIETYLNKLNVEQYNLRMERYILHNADLILPVSKRYSILIQEKYPYCKGRTAYLHNGVNYIDLEHNGIMREKGRIIAVGGDRIIKNNIIVADAVAKLDCGKILTVYGHLYHPDDLPVSENIAFKGLISQEKLYEEMMKSELYVLNSIYEPFALSVFDALLCGCSILVTCKAGALELLNVSDCDVIYDPMDENDIAEKIKYLLQHPNNTRLLQNLDFNKLSFKAEVNKLEDFCKEICQKGRH